MTDRTSLVRVRRFWAGPLLALLVFGMVFGIPGRALADANPTVTGITPAQGSARGGTAVTITGADFQPGVRVYIGSLPLEAVTRVSSTQITGTTAQSDGGAGRSATVLVVNPDGSAGSLTSAFFFVTSDTPLTISSVAPSVGSNSGGTNLTIVGAGFNGAASVLFGDVPATGVNVLGSSAIFVRTPANVNGTVPVTVTNHDGTTTRLANAFTYSGGASITSVSPAGGAIAGGTTVMVTGNGFTRGATVTFGVTSATSVIYVNSTLLVAVTPAATVGTVPVLVTNADGQAAAGTQGFTYGPPPGSIAPVLTSVSPISGQGQGGTQVTLTGTGFSGAATVYFGSTPSPSVVWNGASSMFARPPSNVAGPVSIRIVNSDGGSVTMANAYTYDSGGGLSLASVTPTSVSSGGGTVVTILGSSINPGSWVTFNGVPAPVSTIIGTTQIVSTTPAGLSGVVTIGVTQIGGVSASLPAALTVTGTPVVTPPVVTPPVVIPPVVTPPVAGGSGTFLVAPIFSASGQALAIFGGGSVDQLEVAAVAAKASGVWLQDGTGAYRLLVIGGPAFLKDDFKQRFAAGIVVNTPAALTRQ